MRRVETGAGSLNSIESGVSVASICMILDLILLDRLDKRPIGQKSRKFVILSHPPGKQKKAALPVSPKLYGCQPWLVGCDPARESFRFQPTTQHLGPFLG